MDLVGRVEGKDVVIVDDMIDTASTLCKGAELLKASGARRVFAFATHGLFSADAIEQIEASCIERVVVTDSIPLKQSSPKISQITIAVLLAEAIRRAHQHESFSDLCGS